MSIEVKIAVGVGEKFAIVSSKSISHISLKNTHTLVEVDTEVYSLYKGATFEESQKVDELFDTIPVKELNIKDHLADKKKKYNATEISSKYCGEGVK